MRPSDGYYADLFIASIVRILFLVITLSFLSACDLNHERVNELITILSKVR